MLCFVQKTYEKNILNIYLKTFTVRTENKENVQMFVGFIFIFKKKSIKPIKSKKKRKKTS